MPGTRLTASCHFNLLIVSSSLKPQWSFICLSYLWYITAQNSPPSPSHAIFICELTFINSLLVPHAPLNTLASYFWNLLVIFLKWFFYSVNTVSQDCCLSEMYVLCVYQNKLDPSKFYNKSFKLDYLNHENVFQYL